MDNRTKISLEILKVIIANRDKWVKFVNVNVINFKHGAVLESIEIADLLIEALNKKQ